MSNGEDQFEVRRITADSVGYRLALHRVLDLPRPSEGGALAPEVADLLANARRGAVSLDLFLGAYRHDQLVSACLAVQSPGAAAMVLVSSDLKLDTQRRATVAVLKAVQPAAWERSIVLLELLTTPDSRALGSVLGEAGFRHLTRLRYLKRRGPCVGCASTPANDLEWVQYRRECEPLFHAALERTYVQSQDCPELMGLRSTADVLAGHRATGIFDARLWWVAKRGDKPVGVILLGRIPHEPALEIVYMGVAQTARGTGVADALLRRAVEAASRFGATTLALAVDERNTPARRMYKWWDFVETATRDAWIASSPCTKA